ncbi:hypothetical protein, partial [Streptomyces sp. NPDC058964]|uniref:hypothetical protein n=1 Tax=Streptomyces sp. NPDC058964 TaxID=3346681 RepID=UPI0036C9BA75
MGLQVRDPANVHCHNYWCAAAHTETTGEQLTAAAGEPAHGPGSPVAPGRHTASASARRSTPA